MLSSANHHRHPLDDGQMDLVLSRLEEAGCDVKKSRTGWVAQCPVHDDQTPSLSIRAGNKHPVVLHCHGGCPSDEVLEALDLTLDDICAAADPLPPGCEAAYTYQDLLGHVVAQKRRHAKKRFSWWHPGGTGDWEHGRGDAPLMLYRLPELATAVKAAETIYVVEGEKDVDAMRDAGYAATCNPNGAAEAWADEYNGFFAGAPAVVIVADRDEPGRRHAAQVAASLRASGMVRPQDVTVVEAAVGKDAADHLAAGRSVKEFIRVTEVAVGDAPGNEYRPSWAPVDLSAHLDGSYEPPRPTLMVRSDGQALLYPGLVHSFHGESESGKSLLLQIEAAHLISRGDKVLFIDFESDPASVAERLMSFGAAPEDVREHFTYVRPEFHPDSEAAAWESLLEGQYALAVVDGVTDSLSIFGYKTKENDDVTAWMRALPRTIADRTGAAVVVIDHVTKDAGSRGRFAIGGQAKMAGLTGAAYVVEVVQPLARGLCGVISLRVGKDRPGAVRAACGKFRHRDRTQEAARITVDSTKVGTCTVRSDPPRNLVDDEDAQPFRPTALMERASRVVETDPGLSKNQVVKRVEGNRAATSEAIAVLVDEGYVAVTPGSNSSQRHTSLKPYREAKDPQSDLYDDAETDGNH